MKNLKTILLLISITFSAVSCAQWGKGEKIKGNGEVSSIIRSLGEYDGVKVAGSMDVKLVNGIEGSIVIKGESNLFEYIDTKISNNNLIIKVKDGYSLKTTRSLVVTVPCESINYVALAGSGDINNSGSLDSDDLEVALAGSGDINLNISSSNTKVKIAGSGDIELKGNSNALSIAVAGSGDFDGSNLKSVNVDAAISGSGTAKVNCSGALKGRVSGSGDIIYKGTPKTKDTKVSGSGSIKS
ncbi:DUF2807 domain-containing protein [Winogradskyella sp. DF17]|uniref:DUF2807 domain-containing protein n=1 Tax=Winogradskyella pelagia TaxID=2819984 RepID=A0ABS3T0Q8_9FLAO|nr:head GIN domain-containing protein [Winogradskyella sp. DF17]MBO3116323.1 DUF2807 domain-containing protein [Winogradskyella sp. DF17]